MTGTRRLAAGGGINSVVAKLDAQIAVLRDEEYQLQFLEFFAYIKRVTDHYIEQGEGGQARRVIAHQQAMLDAMPDGYWKTRYQTALAQRYGHLLDASTVARAGWGEAEGDGESESGSVPLMPSDPALDPSTGLPPETPR